MKFSLLIFASIFAISSSVKNYYSTWLGFSESLQITSLATLFSGIAAIGILVQLSKCPQVYTSIYPSNSSDPVLITLQPNIEETMTFNIYNPSKATASNVIVQAVFPSEVLVQSVNCPAWNTIRNGGRIFEIHLDIPTINPIHPNNPSSFSVKVQTSESVELKPVIVHTSAKDMATTKHSFFVTTKQMNLEKKELRAIIRKRSIPMFRTREVFLLAQKVNLFILVILGVYPWIFRIF